MENLVEFKKFYRMANLKSFIPLIVWLIIILFLSGYPGNQLPKVAVWQFDKLVHTLMYAILSFLFFLPFCGQCFDRKKRFKIGIVIILFGVSFGGFMEILQENIFINRSGSWIDFIANTVGAVLGVLIAPLVLKYLPINRWLRIK